MVTSLGRNNGSRRQQKRQHGEREQRRAKIIKGLEKKKKKKEKRKKSTRYQVPGKKVPGLRMAHYDSYVPNREHTVSSERRMRREGGGSCVEQVLNYSVMLVCCLHRSNRFFFFSSTNYSVIIRHTINMASAHRASALIFHPMYSSITRKEILPSITIYVVARLLWSDETEKT